MGNEYPRRGGCLRRVIDLQRWDARTVVGWLEDDFHHFGMTLLHDGHMVSDVRVATPRTPWATCLDVGTPLKKLVGQPLVSRSSDIGTLMDMRQQCTHVYDLAGLLLAHAYHGREHCRYEAIVADREISNFEGLHRLEMGRGQATLLCDEQQVMSWVIEGDNIIEPNSGEGQSLNLGFREWTEAMPEQPAEYANILRRAILVAYGRIVNFEHFENAAAMHQPPLCHTFQPERSQSAHRHLGCIRNYEKSSEGMLSKLKEKP